MSKHNVYPSKTTLNLMIRERKEGDLRILIPGLVVGLVLVYLFCHFAVVGRLSKAAQAEEAAIRAEQELLSVQEELTSYDEVAAQYSRYFSDALFSADIPQECMDVLALMEEKLMGRAAITSYSFAGDTLLLQMEVSTLSVTSELMAALYEEPMVANVSISTATDVEQKSLTDQQTVKTGKSTVIMTIVLQEVEE